MRIIAFALLLISFSSHAQQTAVIVDFSNPGCRMKEDEERAKMNAVKSDWASKDESSSCVDEVGTMFADCLGSGAGNASCDDAMTDITEDDVKEMIKTHPEKYGINGSTRAVIDRQVNEANCVRLRAHCAKNVLDTKNASCFSGTAPGYQGEVVAYINSYMSCMESVAASMEQGARDILSPPKKAGEEDVNIVERSRAIGATDTLECKPKDGYRFCEYKQTGFNPNVAIAEPVNPTPPDPMPVLPTPETLHGEPFQATAPAVLPNTCPGTILGDGVTVITSPTCQVMQNNPQMIIQSVTASGQKVSVPATCDSSDKSNVGDSVECKLKATQQAKPLYLLQSNNELKTCRTDGWVMSCPESFIEQSLQKRVKVLGVAGDATTKPAEGYVHYNRRTGQISTASVGQGVNSNGVMLEFQGKPVIAHTRAPASMLMPTGDAYAVDKFVVQTSKTPVSSQLLQQGLPLMREISLGDR
jgi:hypothetical protein